MEIIPANITHLTELLALSDISFGEGYLTQKDIAQYFGTADNYIFVAVNNKQVTGFITGITCPESKLHTEVLEAYPLQSNETGIIGVVKQVCVHPNFYREGIADELLKHIIKAFKKCSELLCISWQKGNTTPMSKLLLKNNFKLKQTILNYWGTESIIKKYDCAICGSPPCKCTAELFVLNKKRG